VGANGEAAEKGGRRPIGGSLLGARVLVAALAVLALAAQIAAVYRTNVHWDEFALLHHADTTQTTGVFESGGRPGLATLVLLPFVVDCDDEVSVARRARLLWVSFTVLFLAGLAATVAQLGSGRERFWDATLAVALVGLVPAFLDTSVQVRSDQIALAGGAWGAALLLASRTRPAFALAAGLAFGCGLLGSQKLAYVAVLAGLLAVGQLWMLREWRPGRDAFRAALCVAGCGLALAAFHLLIERSFDLPSAAPARVPVSREVVAGGLSAFEFYRGTIGWSQYVEILPTLIPHALLLALLAAATPRALAGGANDRRRVGLAWAVLALGIGVALFHAAAFRYFWMTLGLFPAVGLALARRPAFAVIPTEAPRNRRLLGATLAVLLVGPATLAAGMRMHDTQAVQRQSLAFVHRNFPRDAAGFHPERGLVCQAGAQPRYTYLSKQIHWLWGRGPGLRSRSTNRLIRRFREEPVVFILQSFRLNQFPQELRSFWADHYQPYQASVFVAGRRLAGEKGEQSEFELIVPGPYRWIPLDGSPQLAVDGQLLRPGEVQQLEPGSHLASFVEDVGAGLLVLALAEPPGEAPQRFYR